MPGFSPPSAGLVMAIASLGSKYTALKGIGQPWFCPCPSSVPQGRTQMVCQPQAFVPSPPIYQVSGFPPSSAFEPGCFQKKPEHPLPVPRFLTAVLPGVASWKCSLGPCKIKTPTKSHSDCVASVKRLKFSESQFPSPVKLGGEFGALRAYKDIQTDDRIPGLGMR